MIGRVIRPLSERAKSGVAREYSRRFRSWNCSRVFQFVFAYSAEVFRGRYVVSPEQIGGTARTAGRFPETLFSGDSITVGDIVGY